MKLLLVILLVVASNPPTLTWAFLPNSMPLGLIIQTFPLAEISPSMVDGLASLTRFSAIAEEEGWTNFTVSPLPTLKLFQFSTTRDDVWSIVVCAWPVVIVA